MLKKFVLRSGLVHPHLPIFIGLMVMVTSLSLANLQLYFGYQNTLNVSSPGIAADTSPKVLGSWYGGQNSLTITAKSQEYGMNGGIIALSSKDNPEISIRAHSFGGQTQLKLYKASEKQILDYLNRDAKGIQFNPLINPTGLKLVAQKDIELINYDEVIVNLPLDPIGIYLVKLKQGDVAEADGFIIRSNTGVMAKKSDNQIVFWGIDHATNRSITNGSIALYDFAGQTKQIAQAEFAADGIAKTPALANADIALVKRDQDEALIPLNLHLLNSEWGNYVSYGPPKRNVKYFVFTDRPIYRPGDTLHFKAFSREDYDAVYSLPKTPIIATIYSGYGENKKEIYHQTLTPSDHGGIDGSLSIPDSAPLDYYTLDLNTPESNPENYYSYYSTRGTTSFQIKYFRKPDFFLTVKPERLEYIAGDQINYMLNAEYFSGQPINQGTIEYQLLSNRYYEYEYVVNNTQRLNNDSWHYGFLWGETQQKGKVVLQNNGSANLTLPAKSIKNRSQIYTLSTKLVDNANTDEAATNVLVYSGEFGIFRADRQWSVGIGKPITLQFKLISRVEKPVTNITVTSTLKRTWWEATPPVAGAKYSQFQEKSEQMPPMQGVSDSTGLVNLTFTPKAGGRFELVLQAKDERGNIVESDSSIYVHDDPNIYTKQVSNGSGLQIFSDSDLANPGGLVKVSIVSETPNRDVLLGIERDHLRRYQIIPLSGTKAEVNLPIQVDDMPNIFLSASSFSPTEFQSSQLNLPVYTESKRLMVNLEPDKQRYGPGDTVELKVKTSNNIGQPIPAEIAVWAVDKALFELVNQGNLEIFNAFWRERYNGTSTSHSLEGIQALLAEGGGGCFLGETPITLASGLKIPIKSIHIGDQILTRKSESDATLTPAKVINVHKTTAQGYYTINGSLKVTGNHRVYMNSNFAPVDTLKLGDTLRNSEGNPVKVTSLYWTRAKVDVYNLEIENQHTYFANDLWVHNQKGGEREVFKDTAYWNPRVITNQDGNANLTITLPDNLTTWVIAAVGTTIDTTVGSSTTEVKTSKNIVVRPALPTFLRLGDKPSLSFQVHNFSPDKHSFTTKLSFNAGTMLGPDSQVVEIEPNAFTQVMYNLESSKIDPEAKITQQAVANDNESLSDTIIMTLPVKQFGFYDFSGGQTSIGSHTYNLTLPSKIEPELSTVTLSISPTLMGTLPEVFKYLWDYRYGCTEQTTSRLVPELILNRFPSFFNINRDSRLSPKQLSNVLAYLARLQNQDGSWGFWNDGESETFISTYVVDVLSQLARSNPDLKSEINPLLADIEPYFTKYSKQPDAAYSLTQLSPSRDRSLLDPNINFEPDLLAYKVMANINNGHQDSTQNGVDALLQQAQTSGDGWYWQPGPKNRYGSIEASTALAIRALLLAGRKDEAYKGVLYLTRNRDNYYWGNTFASAQVIQALMQYSLDSNELSPNLTYNVSLNEAQISNGSITSKDQKIDPIALPLTMLIGQTTPVKLQVSGTGNLYGTLSTNVFNTDQAATSVSQQLTLERQYLSQKGAGYTPAVGDTVTVMLKITNPSKANYHYVALEDELPAGMLVVDPGFKNERQTYDDQIWRQAGLNGYQATENGMVLSINKLHPGVNRYFYKARVVSAGEFLLPPAKASLMYAPEIYARTKASVLKIDPNAKYVEDLAKAQAKFGIAKGLADSPTAKTLRSTKDSRLVIIALVFLLSSLTSSLAVIMRKKQSRLKQTSLPLNSQKASEPIPESELVDQSQNPPTSK